MTQWPKDLTQVSSEPSKARSLVMQTVMGTVKAEL